MTHLLIGCGYLGNRIARLWVERGKKVTVVTRRPPRADGLCREGYRTIVGDATLPETLANLPAADVVLLAVPGEVASRTLAVLGTLQDAGRLILISTTGVYGDAAGAWVDENTPSAPTRPGAQASLAAEDALARGPFDHRSLILRLGGIYGPDRVPHLGKLRTGAPLPVRADGWLNLIHVDDAAATVLAAEAMGAEGSVNITDGHPVLRGDYYAQVARLIRAAVPQFVPPLPGLPQSERSAVSRRVSNARMRQMLDVTLQYPSYQEGLAAILGA